jgi:hypothetical protein
MTPEPINDEAAQARNDALRAPTRIPTAAVPSEEALGRAITVIYCEARRLEEKAAAWRADGSIFADRLDEDAAELWSVRAWLERFVTRDAAAEPSRDGVGWPLP